MPNARLELIERAGHNAHAERLAEVTGIVKRFVVTGHANMAGLMVGIFEELGWTGFAIPRLRLRYNVFTTGIIVGLVWGAW